MTAQTPAPAALHATITGEGPAPLGWVISELGDELPFVSVWRTGAPMACPSELGTAADAEQAVARVAADAFGECLRWKTAAGAAAALNYDQRALLTAILG